MPQVDEYGDAPGEKGSHYATMDTILPDKMIHHANTGHGASGSSTFWFYTGRPEGVTIEEWESVGQSRWNRAFSPKE